MPIWCYFRAGLALAIPCALNVVVHAETESAGASDIIVTALRVPVDRADSGVSVAIIDAGEIASRQIGSIAELIGTLPGVAIDRAGGFGGVTSVRIRGAEGAQTLVLLDGVRMNDVAEPAAGFDFGTLQTGNIDRIELLRGPQSVLWGSQAIGGVVNLVTAEPTEALTVRARGEYGYADTWRGYADAAGKAGPLAWSIGGGHERSDGISAADVRNGNTERDGYRATALNGRVRAALAPGLSLDLRANWMGNRFNFDGFPCCTFQLADTGEWSRKKVLATYAGLNLDLFDGRLQNRLGWSRNDTKRWTYDPANNAFDPTVPIENFRSRGRTDRFDYQGHWRLNDRVGAIFGYEHEASRMTTAVNYGGFTGADRARANSDSLFAQVNLKPADGLAINGGLRHDWFSGFGAVTSVGGDLSYSPNGGATRLRASYGEGFKAPTLYQLYGDYGNRGLRAERARGWDAGLAQQLINGQLEIEATYFERRTRNQIDFDIGSYTYGNLARTRARGIEATIRMRPTDLFTVEAHYTHQHVTDDSAASVNRGHDLRRRPRDLLSVRADYAWPFGVKTGAAIRMVGASFEDAASTQRLGSYVVADVTAAIRVIDKVDVTGRIENLFDSHYQTARGYGSYPRAAYVGVRVGY